MEMEGERERERERDIMILELLQWMHTIICSLAHRQVLNSTPSMPR